MGSSEEIMTLEIYFDFNAELIVQAINGSPLNSNIFLFFNLLEPALAGINAKILGTLFFIMN